MCENSIDDICDIVVPELTFQEEPTSFWITNCESQTSEEAEFCTKIDTITNVTIKGKMYRLEGFGKSDLPSGEFYIPDNWVFVDTATPENMSLGNRDDFKLIITEVTDPTDEGNELIELFSPTGHTNHPIKEVSSSS